ncbi:hypothetical protein PIB30_034320 [Stylosanthes scabra]|uniref:LOB domain-containing protein n=1 Tax=Stylosanthes scabra TaxID=79078 RepID=A0ABU6SDJ4_9FABA|nr:hypothetical protein [Stylosanthes scabra]
MKSSHNSKACAACKFQRRRCTKDCILAPYFPADKPKAFTNAHRLFGVCNMTRILNKIDPEQRDECMKSIIFESDMRAKFPVHGCYGILNHYVDLIAQITEELRLVRMWIAYFKQQQEQQYHQPQQQHLPLSHQYELFQPSSEFSSLNVYNESRDNYSVEEVNLDDKFYSKLEALSVYGQFSDAKPSIVRLGEGIADQIYTGPELRSIEVSTTDTKANAVNDSEENNNIDHYNELSFHDRQSFVEHSQKGSNATSSQMD